VNSARFSSLSERNRAEVAWSLASTPMTTFQLGQYPVHRVGFGAMQLPGPGVFGPPRDRDEALRVVKRAVELGVDHIDTAQFYGPDVANDLIREALHPYPDDLALVSKVGARRDDKGAWIFASQPDELRADIEENLRELGVDQLAAVNLRIHGDDPGVPAEVERELFDRQLTTMITAREDGLIAGIGLSSITLDHLEIALERTEIVCVQNAYNLVERSSQACWTHAPNTASLSSRSFHSARRSAPTIPCWATRSCAEPPPTWTARPHRSRSRGPCRWRPTCC
jgi:aryl-alcohol dehydrogenase-like predicted oxidoreductase